MVMTFNTTTPCGVNCTVRSKVTFGISSTGSARAGPATAAAAASRIASERSMPRSRVPGLERPRALHSAYLALAHCAPTATRVRRLLSRQRSRRMRKLILPAVLVAALVPASIAVADGGFGFGASNPTAVAATFSATQTKTSTRTCTTSDNRTIVVTDGTYTGTATGDATLAGALTIRARSIIDTTNKVGLVTGQFGIDTSGQPNARGAFQAVYSTGQIAGLAAGRAGASHTSLVANLSAAFD